MSAQPRLHEAPSLATLDEKLDYIVARQRYLESFVEEMTPVLRDAMGVGAEKLQGFEEKGYFALGNELLVVVQRVLDAYSPEDLRLLGDNIVRILDTVRNVTQPDVLAVANEATNALHDTDSVAPVGLFGMVKATRDDDVQRGLAVLLQVLRQIGRAADGLEGATPPVRTAPAVQEPEAPESPKAPVQHDDVVEWEGVRFNPQGFLLDANDWTPELADRMASALGIALTHEHWTVVNWAREDYLANGASPNVRRVAAGSGVGTKDLYRLFPKTPGKTTAQVAGIPKPVGCV